jgi:hypothetical protein
LRTEDKGKFVTAQIIAKNSKGSATTVAASQHVVQEPTLSATPAITGSPIVGATLGASAGTWLAFPKVATSVKWYRCDSPTSAGASRFSGASRCTAISGATNARYRVSVQDKGKYIAAIVTARNSVGTKSVTTASTSPIL